MRKPASSEAKELFRDLGEFILALLPRTVAKITGGSIAAVVAIYCIFGHPVYAWLAWLFVALFLFSAAFSAWRDKHKQVCFKDRHDLFIEMVDLIKNDTPKHFQSPPRIQPIGSLVKYSNEIENEDELHWFLEEFKIHGYGSPLDCFDTDSDGRFKGQWLAVLRDARHTQRDIKTEVQFLDFLATQWSGKDRWIEATFGRKVIELEKKHEPKRS